MYNKQNQGYGICGARNIYSSKVRVDNWVEDTIGSELAKQNRSVETLYRTNTASSFIPPSEQPQSPQPNAKMPSVHELKSKNKDGMSYALLFEHGPTSIGNERLTSVRQQRH
jgi:hypothetical protein